MRPAAETGGPRAAVDAFFTLVCPGLWSALDEPARDRYRANGHMMLAEFAGEPYELGPGDVATIDLPALVISGTDSHSALQAIAATLASALPDARFVELAGSGHVTYAERPDQFARAVGEFAADLADTVPVDVPPPGDRPALTELLAATSVATDLVTGQPLEHALPTCPLSVHVGRRLGLDPGALREVHSVALLRFLGCTADAPEMARLAGGDKPGRRPVDPARPDAGTAPSSGRALRLAAS